MQGELQEIDIRTLLELAAFGQRTGQLLIEPPAPMQTTTSNGPDTTLSAWQISFSHGKIIYAGHAKFYPDRLTHLIQRYGHETLPKEVETSAHHISNPYEYGALIALLESQRLTIEQTHSLLRQMIQESLLEIMALPRGRFFFVAERLGEQPTLATFEVLPLLQWLTQHCQEWQGFYPYIRSPDHCPNIIQPEALGQALSVATVNTLLKFADGQTSLRNLSYRFDRNLNMIARAIYPCVQRGWIEMIPAAGAIMALGGQAAGLDAPPWRIACLDDDAVVRQSLRLVLEQYHCQVTVLAHPLEAFSTLFQINPHLIFCDITMPQLDGYEVCAMLRQTDRFRQTPIIMLTGQDGYINRIRAKIVGATSYLTKPIQESELVMLLEQHLGWKGVKKHFSQYLEGILEAAPGSGTMEESTVFSVKSD
jgi:twitching motility two-component system response regulator PilG